MTFEIVSHSRITGFGLHRQVLATVKRPSAAEHKFAEHVDLKAGHFEAHAVPGETVTVTPLTTPFRGAIKSTAVALGGTAAVIISIERKGHVPPPFVPVVPEPEAPKFHEVLGIDHHGKFIIAS